MGVRFAFDAVEAEAVQPPAGDRPLQKAIEADTDELEALGDRAVRARIGREQGLRHVREPAAEQLVERRDQEDRGQQHGGTAEQDEEVSPEVRPVAPEQIGGGQTHEQQISLAGAGEQDQPGKQQDGQRLIPAAAHGEPVDGDGIADGEHHRQIVRVHARVQAEPVVKQHGALAKQHIRGEREADGPKDEQAPLDIPPLHDELVNREHERQIDQQRFAHRERGRPVERPAGQRANETPDDQQPVAEIPDRAVDARANAEPHKRRAEQQQQPGRRPDGMLQRNIGEQAKEQNEIGREIEQPVSPVNGNGLQGTSSISFAGVRAIGRRSPAGVAANRYRGVPAALTVVGVGDCPGGAATNRYRTVARRWISGGIPAALPVMDIGRVPAALPVSDTRVCRVPRPRGIVRPTASRPGGHCYQPISGAVPAALTVSGCAGLMRSAPARNRSVSGFAPRWALPPTDTGHVPAALPVVEPGEASRVDTGQLIRGFDALRSHAGSFGRRLCARVGVADGGYWAQSRRRCR